MVGSRTVLSILDGFAATFGRTDAEGPHGGRRARPLASGRNPTDEQSLARRNPLIPKDDGADRQPD